MKTIADRPIDRRDIEELREIFSGKLDEAYILKRLSPSSGWQRVIYFQTCFGS